MRLKTYSNWSENNWIFYEQTEQNIFLSIQRNSMHRNCDRKNKRTKTWIHKRHNFIVAENIILHFCQYLYLYLSDKTKKLKHTHSHNLLFFFFLGCRNLFLYCFLFLVFTPCFTLFCKLYFFVISNTRRWFYFQSFFFCHFIVGRSQ